MLASVTHVIYHEIYNCKWLVIVLLQIWCLILNNDVLVYFKEIALKAFFEKNYVFVRIGRIIDVI